MTGLKTLKEIEGEIRKRFETRDMRQPGGGLSDKTQREFFRRGYKVSFEYAFKHLREEAINHIKKCKNVENFSTNNKCGFYYDEEKKQLKPRPIFCEVCEWIKRFFNIRISPISLGRKKR